jgi:hypothetical protein
MQLFLMFALAVGANAIGTILIKIGTGKIGDISFSLSSAADILKNIYILGGILLYAISFPAYNYILSDFYEREFCNSCYYFIFFPERVRVYFAGGRPAFSHRRHCPFGARIKTIKKGSCIAKHEVCCHCEE